MFEKENMYPDNCNKCTRPKYHKKHPNYCETRCNIILVDAAADEDMTLSTKSTTEKILPDLGPLGNLLRTLILASTY